MLSLYSLLLMIGISQQQTISYTNSGSDWSDTLCTSGTAQSPINLQVTSGTCDNSMVLDIQFVAAPLSVKMDRLQYTIYTSAQVSNLYATDIDGNLFGNYSFVFSGYTATEFYFHSPSEHTIEGSQYDLEMQIVHVIKDEFSLAPRKTAIVSLLFEVSSSSQPFFDTYSFALVSGGTTTTTNTTTTNTTNTTTTPASQISKAIPNINFNELLGSQLDANPSYYTYVGSITKPPCTEEVNWYIVNSILPITSDQLSAFTGYYGSNSTFANGQGNNRETQSANDRTIKKGGVACEEQFVYFFSFFILYIFINYFIFKLL